MVAKRMLVAGCVMMCAGWCCAQSAAVPEVRLEAHDGVTTFAIGEPIRLDLVMSSPTGVPMMVNATDYGDNSDPVAITPTTGWTAWQGRSGHDYAQMQPLGATPVRIPIRVDQVAIFREPGRYEVRVTENRVEAGPDLMHLSRMDAVQTNAVTIELTAMTAERETEIVRGVENDLANATGSRAGYEARAAAVQRLAALQGEAALVEKVKLLVEEQEDFRRVEREAWATTRDLNRQLELLELAWRDVRSVPAYDTTSALSETRALMAGQPMEGWTMVAAAKKLDAVGEELAKAHQQDMVELLESVPQRTGKSRTYAAYYLLLFGGLPKEDEALARKYAVEEFPHMDDVAQHMLMETPRPPSRAAELMPSFKAMLEKKPADKDALAAVIEVDGEAAVPYVVRAVCAADGPPLLDAFAKVKADRLPQVDACLKPLLGVTQLVNKANNAGRAGFVWKQRVTMAARFGTAELLPAIEASLPGQVALNPQDVNVVGPVLAAEMRENPAVAVKRLQDGMPVGTAWFEVNKVYESAGQPFPAVVQDWLRERVRSGEDDASGNAAYELSVGGVTSDAAVLEERLAALRAGGSVAAKGEGNFVSALLHAKAWTLSAEERATVVRGCVTEQCRRFAK